MSSAAGISAFLPSPWKLLGIAGVACFAVRWIIQVITSHRTRSSVITMPFWLATGAGSLILITYFALGPSPDQIGVLSNTFPLAIAAYNIALTLRRRGERAQPVTSAASRRSGGDEGCLEICKW